MDRAKVSSRIGRLTYNLAHLELAWLHGAPTAFGTVLSPAGRGGPVRRCSGKVRAF